MMVSHLSIKYHYVPAEQRCISELHDDQNVLLKKIVYNGNYEIIESDGNTYEVNYLSSSEGLFAIAVKQNNDPTEIFCIETDLLGSILGLYNEAGQAFYTHLVPKYERVRERNPTDWSYSLPSQGGAGGGKPSWLIRGYTGHEHLPEQLSPFGGAGVGLINMNGRLYDPLVGQMLGTDPALQNPFNSQNYNKYSYVLNNPLKYTDPTGWYVVNNIDDPNFGQLTGHLDAKFSNWNDYTSYVKQELQMADMKLLQLDRVTVTRDAYVSGGGGPERLDSKGGISYHFKTIYGRHYVRTVANNLPREQSNEANEGGGSN